MTSVVKRVFPVDPSQLLPAVTPDNEPYWNGLAQGYLQLQTCDGCARTRHPIAPVCPYCRGTAWSWRRMSGAGTIYSYVRFHRSYLPEFADLMPYVVLTVQLAEGARIFGRLVGDYQEPRIGLPVELVIEQWPNGRCVPTFAITQHA